MKTLKTISKSILLSALIFTMVVPTTAFADEGRSSYDINSSMEQEFILRGLEPTQNLKGKVVEDIKFSPDMVHYADYWTNGKREVEIWDRSTEVMFHSTNVDSQYIATGYLKKNSAGQLEFYDNPTLDYLERGVITHNLPATYLTKLFFGLPKDMKPIKDVTELYGYIIYDYKYDELRLSDEASRRGESRPFYSRQYKMKLFKFNPNEPKINKPAIKETAKPTSSKVMVNGKEVKYRAYNIKGNNYFKLRDIAASLVPTKKSIGVKYNDKMGFVMIDTWGVYYPGYDAPYIFDGKTKTALLNTTRTYVGYDFMDLKVYNIENNNYYQLREICEILDIGLDWDGANNTITLDTKKSYEPDGKTEVKKEEPKYLTSTGAVKKEYIRKFNLALMDNTVITKNSKGEVVVTVNGPELPAELKDFKYNIEIRVEGSYYDGEKKHNGTPKTSFYVSQGGPTVFTFEKVVDVLNTNIDIRLEKEGISSALQSHYISTSLKNMVFENNLDTGGTVDFNKDLSKVFVGF